jgi:serine/threonine protein phosphatase PrpC
MTLRAIATAPFGLATSPGRTRRHNEDASLTGPDWYLVADGMGGHAAGDVASRLVVDTFRAHPPDPDAIVDSITETCRRANTAVRRHATATHAHGMGSTLVGLVVGGGTGTVTVFHVGDARCYRLVDGELRLLTHDHTHVQELVEAGLLTTDQARHHPLRNVVTRAIGLDADVAPQLVTIDARPSRFLLCSDGLTVELGPRQIGRALSGFDDPRAAADRLVELAVEADAHDDVTALVVDVAPLVENVRRPCTDAR